MQCLFVCANPHPTPTPRCWWSWGAFKSEKIKAINAYAMQRGWLQNSHIREQKSIIISYPRICAAWSQGWQSEGMEKRKETERVGDKLGKTQRNGGAQYSRRDWKEKAQTHTHIQGRRKKWAQREWGEKVRTRELLIVTSEPAILKEKAGVKIKYHHLGRDRWVAWLAQGPLWLSSATPSNTHQNSSLLPRVRLVWGKPKWWLTGMCRRQSLPCKNNKQQEKADWRIRNELHYS